MDNTFMSNSIRTFKRKRKSSVQVYRFEESCLDDDIKPFKRLITDDDYDTFTESSNSTTPLYSNKYQEYETSTNGCMSSDDSEYRYKNDIPEIKSEPKINDFPSLQTKSKRTNSFLNQPVGKSSAKSKQSSYEDFFGSTEQDTFRVDMGRFQCFNTSAPNVNSFLQADLKSAFELPVSNKLPPSSTPPRMQGARRNRSHIYKPHRHNKSVSVSHVPCKGPACTSQICCAHFCSQKCYDNQKWPIGSGGAFKTSMPDYDSCGQPEINVTDYGLPYPDHTYCRDHRNLYFTADPHVDRPPYFEFVESLFYDEKEARIKNPVPAPNLNGDPISSNGYSSQATRRGRPKRSNVVGLLNSYIFHPSSEVIYTPFVFKESIVEADRYSNEIKSQEPIIHALRQCSNLYKDVRPDIPKEVLYGSCGAGLKELYNSDALHDLVKNECTTDLIDDLFGSVADDFSFK